jgi:hypothetical protein
VTDPVDHAVAGVESDPDEWRLSRIIRIVTLLSAGLALEAVMFAALTSSPGYLLPGALFLGAAAWTTWARAHIADRGAPWVASRLVIVTLSAMLGLMLVDPVNAASLAVAPLVPFRSPLRSCPTDPCVGWASPAGSPAPASRAWPWSPRRPASGRRPAA